MVIDMRYNPAREKLVKPTVPLLPAPIITIECLDPVSINGTIAFILWF